MARASKAVQDTAAETDQVTQPQAAAAATEASRPVLVMRHSRGRLGGSTALLMLTQRARAAGREVIVIDGDTKSKTLMEHYPPGTSGGAIVPQYNSAGAFLDLVLQLSQ